MASPLFSGQFAGTCGGKNNLENRVYFSGNPYQIEHQLLVDAIRNNKPYNEGHRASQAALAGIMGRMAYESGQHIYANEAMTSNIELFPGIDNITWDTKPPVEPDAAGHYPYAIPGVTKGI